MGTVLVGGFLGENMVVIGLTGGIGSGKSFVLNLLHERWNISVYEADKVAKELMMPPHDIYKEIVREFGDGILNERENADGVLKAIDSEKLRRVVMNDPEALTRLNSIVHPGVKKYFKDIIASESYDVIIIESAILLQDGYEEICDEIWYVRAERDVRLERIMKNRGYTLEKAESFMDNQPGDDYYMDHADRVINNNDMDGVDTLFPELESLMQSFKDKYPLLK